MFTEEYQKMLRARSMNNRGALLDSKECGCFFCLKMYTPDRIQDWLNEETAQFSPYEDYIQCQIPAQFFLYP